MEREYSIAHAADILKTAEEKKILELEIKKQKQQKYGFFIGLAIMIVFAGIFFRQRKRINKLLLNILPIDVAKEHKTKGKVAAKSFSEATVLFIDFKGFTNISEKMTPEELVKEIDACFSKFDNITYKHGIEKIKTNGYAYM